MKKLAILLIFMLGLVAFGMAQSAVGITLATNDTLTNTDNGTYTITGTPLQGAMYAYSVQVYNDSISGSGTSVCYLQKLDGGTTWVTVTTSATDSVSFTADGSQYLPENTTGFIPRQLRLYCNHTGTGVDRISAWITMRKLNK